MTAEKLGWIGGATHHTIGDYAVPTVERNGQTDVDANEVILRIRRSVDLRSEGCVIRILGRLWIPSVDLLVILMI